MSAKLKIPRIILYEDASMARERKQDVLQRGLKAGNRISRFEPDTL
jgi:hypothetical protein